MGDLIRAGKVRYFGLSNFRGWRLAEAVGLCRELGMPAPIALQPYYHALNRQPEVELLPAAAHFGLGVVPFSPLARGMLTGKYRPGEPPPADSRAGRADPDLMRREWREESLQVVAELRKHAEAKGMTTGQFALNWLLGNEVVSAVLAGPRTLEQWTEYLGALAFGFDAEDAALVDRLVPPGYPSTYGYHDPNFPVVGRVARAEPTLAARSPGRLARPSTPKPRSCSLHDHSGGYGGLRRPGMPQRSLPRPLHRRNRALIQLRRRAIARAEQANRSRSPWNAHAASASVDKPGKAAERVARPSPRHRPRIVGPGRQS